MPISFHTSFGHSSSSEVPAALRSRAIWGPPPPAFYAELVVRTDHWHDHMASMVHADHNTFMPNTVVRANEVHYQKIRNATASTLGYGTEESHDEDKVWSSINELLYDLHGSQPSKSRKWSEPAGRTDSNRFLMIGYGPQFFFVDADYLETTWAECGQGTHIM